jgi:preprotein translocase subunit SecA
VEHLDAMMKLREAIGLHGYGQRDPLVEYKQEAYEMFQRLQGAIGYDVARLMYKVKIVTTSSDNKNQEPNNKSQMGSGANAMMLEGDKIEEAIEAGDLKLEEVPEPTGDFEEEEREIKNQQISKSANGGGENAMSLRGGNQQMTDAAISPAGDELVPMTKDNFKQVDEHNIGRNDPCWCGSGKKYKKCHGA